MVHLKLLPDVLTDRFASAMQGFRHMLLECHLLAYVQVRLAASHLPVQELLLSTRLIKVKPVTDRIFIH